MMLTALLLALEVLPDVSRPPSQEQDRPEIGGEDFAIEASDARAFTDLALAATALCEASEASGSTLVAASKPPGGLSGGTSRTGPFDAAALLLGARHALRTADPEAHAEAWQVAIDELLRSRQERKGDLCGSYEPELLTSCPGGRAEATALMLFWTETLFAGR